MSRSEGVECGLGWMIRLLTAPFLPHARNVGLFILTSGHQDYVGAGRWSGGPWSLRFAFEGVNVQLLTCSRIADLLSVMYVSAFETYVIQNQYLFQFSYASQLLQQFDADSLPLKFSRGGTR